MPKSKEKIKFLIEIKEFVEKEGCYQEVVEAAAYGWTKYKGKQDEMVAALDFLATKLIDKKTARDLIKNEHTEGHLNISLFPHFREVIKKISK